MGSGSSKAKTVSAETRSTNLKTEPRPSVAKTNNNNARPVDEGNTRNNFIRGEVDSLKINQDSAQKQELRTLENDRRKNDVLNERHNIGRKKRGSDWESDTDSIPDDPWDEYLGPARSTETHHTSNASRSMQEREKELNEQNKDSNYPETYAQRLIREQYKLDQAKLLRQKTIYRDTDEWKLNEQEELEEKKSKGFDASKFRQANAGKENAIAVSPTTQDLQTPRYITAMNQSSYEMPKETSENKKHFELPSYSPEEEELMKMLEEDEEWPHQTAIGATMHRKQPEK